MRPATDIYEDCTATAHPGGFLLLVRVGRETTALRVFAEQPSGDDELHMLDVEHPRTGVSCGMVQFLNASTLEAAMRAFLMFTGGVGFVLAMSFYEGWLYLDAPCTSCTVGSNGVLRQRCASATVFGNGGTHGAAYTESKQHTPRRCTKAR